MKKKPIKIYQTGFQAIREDEIAARLEANACPAKKAVNCASGWAIGLGLGVVGFFSTMLSFSFLLMQGSCIVTINRETGEQMPVASSLIDSLPWWMMLPFTFLLWGITGFAYGAGFGAQWFHGSKNIPIGVLLGLTAPSIIFAIQPWVEFSWAVYVPFFISATCTMIYVALKKNHDLF